MLIVVLNYSFYINPHKFKLYGLQNIYQRYVVGTSLKLNIYN